MAKVLAVCTSKAHVSLLDAQPEAQGSCMELVNGRPCGLPVAYHAAVEAPAADVLATDPTDAQLPLLTSPLTQRVLDALAGESPENIQTTFSDPVVLAVIQGAWSARLDGAFDEGAPPDDVVLTAGDAPRDVEVHEGETQHDAAPSV